MCLANNSVTFLFHTMGALKPTSVFKFLFSQPFVFVLHILNSPRDIYIIRSNAMEIKFLFFASHMSFIGSCLMSRKWEYAYDKIYSFQFCFIIEQVMRSVTRTLYQQCLVNFLMVDKWRRCCLRCQSEAIPIKQSVLLKNKISESNQKYLFRNVLGIHFNPYQYYVYISTL